jgi:transcriptional regulator with XRE-family HTH domain
MDIGTKIRNARIAKGMTQEELGKLLGVQKSAIAKYENGRVVNIKRSTLKRISEVLGIRPVELISEEQQKKSDIASDIAARLIKDKEFLELVEMLNSLDKEKIQSVKQMLKAFL